MPTVHYTNHKSFGSSHKPIANVELHTPTGTVNFNALIDTGADYTVFPDSYLSMWPKMPTSTIPVRSVSGSAVYTIIYGQLITVEGFKLKADVLFSPTLAKGALLGRVDLLTAFQVGLDSSQWLWV